MADTKITDWSMGPEVARGIYSVDARDRLVELKDVVMGDSYDYLASLSSAAGTVISYEPSMAHVLQQSFRITWTGRRDDQQEAVWAFVYFPGTLFQMSGRPNDEAIRGHPYDHRGLINYGIAVEVLDSSLIRALERMNRVHGGHKSVHYERFRHFVFMFKEETFECVADGYRAWLEGGVRDRFERMAEILEAESGYLRR